MPIGKTTNPLLQQVENGVKAKLAPQFQNALQRIVLAGLTIMYSPQSHQVVVQQLSKPGNPLVNVAEGAAKLMAQLYKQSRGTIPMQVMIPASVILMCEGMDFLSKSSPQFMITPQTVARCAQDTTEFMLKVLGINQNQLHTVVAHGLHRAQMSRSGVLQTASGGGAGNLGIIAAAMHA